MSDHESEEFDEHHFPRPLNTDFSDLIDRAMSRREFLKSTASVGIATFVASTVTVAEAADSPLIGFSAVAATDADTVTLPPGYSWQVVASWGDPIFSEGETFDQTTRGTGASQELAVGDNNDGMAFFQIDDNRGVMAVNNEYVNRRIMFPDGIETADDVRKGKAGHGVTIMEVQRSSSNMNWRPVIDGKLNRRITADTPMLITGPAAGHDAMKTVADPTGMHCLGTWNNCGNGRTPWGTYLACEENVNSYFASTDKAFDPGPRHRRYGIGNEDRGYRWYRHDARFDISRNPNEPHRSGYIVEIDPMDPQSVPKKRTALGRFKHENAAVVVASDGRVVVYQGDDERGEFLYRFVSKNRYVPGDDAVNRDLLDDGTLYVARFGDADEKLSGRGEWIELSFGKNGIGSESGFDSHAEVMIFAREAASVVGATTMDRPEWVAVNPGRAEAYCSLTNNTDRGRKPNKGGDATPVGGPNPRKGNRYGQIVRWVPDNDDHTSATFNWNLFVMAGNPVVHTGLNAGSSNVTPDNMFNSPDGLAFDSGGRLWIQTDGSYRNRGDYAGMGNNQMLCGDPDTGELRRFLVGPVACEVTGTAWTEDSTTLFVGIQHPGGRKRRSHFPDGGNTVPRSSVIAITRDDGGVIGT